MQRSIRGGYFKFPDEPLFQNEKAMKFLDEFNAIHMSDLNTWIEWLKTFMWLVPGRDHVTFKFCRGKVKGHHVISMTVWRYGHRAKHTRMDTTNAILQSVDELGRDMLTELFNKYTEEIINVDIK